MKKILLISPSKIIIKGIEGILSDASEFVVENIFSDLSHSSEVLLKNLNVDLILIDSTIIDFSSRLNSRAQISKYTSKPVGLISTGNYDEELNKLYDFVISLYEDVPSIVKKMRYALESANEEGKNSSNELSIREKEILVYVAKGLLNKEIADKCNLSIHTVITHRKNISRKTGIHSVAGLTVYAIMNNLI